MKNCVRILSLLLAAVLALSALVSCAAGDVPEGMQEASDSSKVDYHLYVPETWVVDLATSAVSAYVSASDPTSVNVMAWSVSVADYTATDWWNDCQNDLQFYRDLTVITEADVTLDGNAARQYVWEGTVNGNVYRFMQTVTIRNYTAYAITFCTLEATVAEDGTRTDTGRFDSHLESFQEILAEFRFS